MDKRDHRKGRVRLEIEVEGCKHGCVMQLLDSDFGMLGGFGGYNLDSFRRLAEIGESLVGLVQPCRALDETGSRVKEGA